MPANLDDTQLLVFNNDNLEALPAHDKQRVEEFVQRGGGALWIAGEHNAYVDHKGMPEDALERTFPAKLAPPRSPEGTGVVLIIDKSSSMEGKKIELARAAAIGVVENLRPEDSRRRPDVRQLFPVGRAHPQSRRQDADQTADLRHHSRWRHSDRARAE